MQQDQSISELKHIRNMMERSSRFISLSGLSGVAAGLSALIGAYIAYPYARGTKPMFLNEAKGLEQWASGDPMVILNTYLWWIAVGTFIAALISAFVFTFIRSRKQGIPLWGNTSKRLIINMAIPIIIGAIFILRLLDYGTFGLVAPGCLIFYGLALLNASRYTLKEIRYLGISQLVLAAINLFSPLGYGIYFWAIGFGVLHIIYGIYMWYTYERNTDTESIV